MAPSAHSDGLLARVRPSCASLVAHKDSAVRVNADKVRTFLDELDWEQFGELAEPQRFPLNFHSEQDEINFLVLYGLVNFGSGFRKDLHKYADRGAHETILFGLLGMYIAVPKLDAKFLQQLSIDLVASYFSIPLERDEELSPGIYISKPGPLKPLAEMLLHVLNESGQKLVDQQMDDFGAFVLANLSSPSEEEETKQADAPTASAVHLVERLVACFPAFDDHRECHGEKVYFLKRVQLAVASIHRRFKETNPALSFTDIDEFTAYSDNVLPCVLHALGVLEYDEELAALIERGEELPAGQRECELRAGAIVACDEIVAASKGRLSTLELDFYLWRVGKEPRFRGLERHATRDTFFY